MMSSFFFGGQKTEKGNLKTFCDIRTLSTEPSTGLFCRLIQRYQYKHLLTTQSEPSAVHWTDTKPKTPLNLSKWPHKSMRITLGESIARVAVHFHYHTTILVFWEAAVILSIDQITGKDKIAVS